jgi:hypothetical protein
MRAYYDAELPTRTDRLRTDDQLQELLSGIGQVVAFETWDRFPDTGGHYRWARVQVGDEKEQPTDGNA